MIKTITIIIALIAASIFLESCARKHECATRKGKKKKDFYYGLQFK